MSVQRVTKDITFVVTDVAGSTELWEWNAEVMDLALQLHDATLRTLIFKHLGHEVTTEGDSFSVVFHDATDALQWCLQVQQELLEVEWPPLLLTNKAAGEVWAMKPEGAYSVSGSEEQLVFRGLRVRMGAHTGNDCSISRHPVTGQLEYSGSTRALAEKVSDAGYGGQIMISETTSQHIYSRLPMLACTTGFDMMLPRQNLRASQPRGSSIPTLNSQRTRRFSVLHSDRSVYLPGQGDEGEGTGRSSTGHISFQSARSSCGSPAVSAEEAAALMARSRLPSPMGSGGRSLARATSEISHIFVEQPPSPLPAAVDRSGPLLIDMGRSCFRVAGQAPEEVELRLTLVVQTNLVGRLQLCPLHLTTPQVAPSYFDAPGAKQSVKYLGHMFPIWDRPHVTICFCAMSAPAASIAARHAAADLRQYTDIVRCTLLACHGYECQEKEGVFMLAFQHTRHALEWGLTLQLALMEAEWRSQWAGAMKPVDCDKKGNVVFKGVRARVGMFHGEVVKIVPHSRTGRADYFGLVLNRSARVQGAAHGGQVLAEGLAVDKAVQEWRALYPQKQSPGRSRMSKYLPGNIMKDDGLFDMDSSSSCLEEGDLLTTVCSFHGASRERGAFRTTPGNLLATPAGLEALLAQDRAMLIRTSSKDTRDHSDLHRQLSGISSSSSSSSSSVSSSSTDPPLGRISVQVDVHGLGLFSLKGIDAPIHLTCVTPRMLSGRFDLYPRGLPTAKATLLKKGAGLLDTVTVELPDVRQMPFAAQGFGTRHSISWSPLDPSHQDPNPLLAAMGAVESPISSHSDSPSILQHTPAFSMVARRCDDAAADSPQIQAASAPLPRSPPGGRPSRANSPQTSAPQGHPAATLPRRHSGGQSRFALAAAPDPPAAIELSAASMPAAVGRPLALAKPAATGSHLGRSRPFAVSEHGGMMDLLELRDALQPESPPWRGTADFSPRPIARSSTGILEARKRRSGTAVRVQASSAAEIRTRQEASIQRSVGLVLSRTRPPEGHGAGGPAGSASEAGGVPRDGAQRQQ